jgi:hypothetical protein
MPCRHHALARLCVPHGHIDSPPCLAHLDANGVRTNTLHVASMQGRCHCDIADAPCYTPLTRSLCRCIEPSPPSLSHCTGPRCPHAMRGYKRDLPHACCPCLWFHRLPVSEHPIPSEQLPEVWPPSLTTLEQLPEAWTEHPITSEQLPEAWPTSPTTEAARHHRRALMSSAPLSYAFLASSWSS